MISISVWLIVAIMTLVFYKTIRFKKDKLETGKYDEFGVRVLILSIVVIFVVKRYFNDFIILQTMLIPIFIVVISLCIAFMIKQVTYDYENKRSLFRRRK